MPHVTKRRYQDRIRRIGQGRPVILVDGAMGYRGYVGMRPVAAELARDLRVVAYDRRGRGESADTQPYAVEREIEDIEALIDEVGGPVHLYGFLLVPSSR